MLYLNLQTTTIRSPEYVSAEPVNRATWLSLLGYCCEQENGGVIVGGGEWKDRQWQHTCGVTLEEVSADCGLWSWRDGDLVVSFYPAKNEKKVRRNRRLAARGGASRSPEKQAAARANGRGGGRPSTRSDSTEVQNPSVCENNRSANPTQSPTKEEEKDKGNRKEREKEKVSSADAAGPRGDLALSSTSSAAGPRPDPRHSEICHLWEGAYREHHGEPYALNGGKDGSALKRFLPLVRELSPDSFIARAQEAWARYRDDRFATKCAQASTIHGLCTFWNDIAAQLKTPTSHAATTSASSTSPLARRGNNRDENGQRPGEIPTDVRAIDMRRL
ncbi:hypothetical protein [Roseimicrobium sp. ORNL1]|uniref:hypothetical protein n=1 Tax=Roseimicrobium sp. ORNL1 TaxID=2711231 RepID=UPI0013E112FD|nr:hypothetical protein [Roseimicrobium sp. ORNL1]QIF04312.1 hypothetical protein G5S37_23240 [Roseimicrobium sp. ORNL1]